MEAAIQRAVDWHRGGLPPGKSLSFFDHHVAGPTLHGGVKNPTRFHTYACLYPESGAYIAVNTGEWPGCKINAIELRALINDYVVPTDAVRRQREITTQYVHPQMSALARWELACEAAVEVKLPVGMFMIGDTVNGNQRVVYLRVAVVAPLVKVLKKFREAAPRISFN